VLCMVHSSRHFISYCKIGSVLFNLCNYSSWKWGLLVGAV